MSTPTLYTAQQQRVFPPLEEKNSSPLLLAERYDNSGSGGSRASVGDVSAEVDTTTTPRAELDPSHSATEDVERETDRDRDPPDSPSHSSRQADAGADISADASANVGAAVLAEPAQVPTAAATVDTANTTPEGCVGCLPRGGVFARLRRRHRRGSADGSDGDAPGVATVTATRVTQGGGSVDGGSSGGGTGKKSWRSGNNSSSSRNGDLLAGKVGSRESSGFSASLSKKAAGESSKPKTLTLEQAESLATSNWGGGGANGSARDIWKELVHVGGGGNGGKGKGSGAGSGGVGLGPSGPAVRLRLRFIPLWDCLSVSRARPSTWVVLWVASVVLSSFCEKIGLSYRCYPCRRFPCRRMTRLMLSHGHRCACVCSRQPHAQTLACLVGRIVLLQCPQES